MASTYGDVQHLLPGNYKRLIANWLEEDCPSLDYGGFVVGESEGEARLLGKSKVRPMNPLMTSMQLMDFSIGYHCRCSIRRRGLLTTWMHVRLQLISIYTTHFLPRDSIDNEY